MPGLDHENRPEAFARSNRERNVFDMDRLADKRPVAADFDGVARLGGRDGLEQGDMLLLGLSVFGENDEGICLTDRLSLVAINRLLGFALGDVFWPR